MKFFGKFEQDTNGVVFRTKTYLCLDGTSSVDEPNNDEILGTLFMLNPGSSRPLGSDSKNPFLNYTFSRFTMLEPDDTMNVYVDIFSNLQKVDKFKKGLVEIKNLFNLRKGSLDSTDYDYFINDINSNTQNLNINKHPEFYGQFVYFSWGTSKLKGKIMKDYSKSIFEKSIINGKTILYVSPKNQIESEKQLSFYHPLGGHWNNEKKTRYIDSMKNVFDTLTPFHEFN